MKIKAIYGIRCGHSPYPKTWHSQYKTLEEKFSCASEEEGIRIAFAYAEKIIPDYPCDPNTRKTKISLISLTHPTGKRILFDLEKSEVELTAFERQKILKNRKS